MHAVGWSRQQALDFMTANTALSAHEIRIEIDRYIAWPGQGGVTLPVLEQQVDAYIARARGS